MDSADQLPSWTDILKRMLLSMADSGPAWAFAVLAFAACGYVFVRKVWPWMTDRAFPWFVGEVKTWRALWADSIAQNERDGKRYQEESAAMRAEFSTELDAMRATFEKTLSEIVESHEQRKLDQAAVYERREAARDQLVRDLAAEVKATTQTAGNLVQVSQALVEKVERITQRIDVIERVLTPMGERMEALHQVMHENRRGST